MEGKELTIPGMVLINMTPSWSFIFKMLWHGLRWGEVRLVTFNPTFLVFELPEKKRN